MTKIFKFNSKQRVKHGDEYIAGHTFVVRNEPDPLPDTTVHGIPIGSVEEWRWAMAAESFGVDFDYQVDVAGGKSVANGSVLDFMLYTSPLWQPVHIKGVYWHSGMNEVEDMMRERLLMEEYKGQIFEPLNVYDWQLPDITTAKKVFQELIPL